MKLLLDTHVLVWFQRETHRLSKRASDLIVAPGNDVLVSAATAWEIAVKHKLGKLEFNAALLDRFEASMRDIGFEPLAITCEHAIAGARLPGPHRDPFDRVLAGQAFVEGLTIVSQDRQFASLGVPAVW